MGTAATEAIPSPKAAVVAGFTTSPLVGAAVGEWVLPQPTLVLEELASVDPVSCEDQVYGNILPVV